MIMPFWFVAGLIILSTLGIIGNIIFLVVTILKEKSQNKIW